MSDGLPRGLRPMLAVSGPLPADDRHGEPVWGYEVKWDGVRAIVEVNPDGGVVVTGRNGTDFTPRYPELARLGAALVGCGGAVLDGEVVALDDGGRPDFGRLQGRMHLVDPRDVRRRMADTPVHLAVFDALWVNGSSLLGCTWDERRAVLERLPLSGGASWQVPRAAIGGGVELLAASRQAGLEGVVAKRRSSHYEPGRRSSNWVKVKNVRSQEVVIGGWVEGERGRAGRIGALAVGVTDDEGLQYVGKVGSGFSEAVLADLGSRLATLARSDSPFVNAVPLRRVHFVQPTLVAEVAFNEWTHMGTLRQPSYKGLRADKDPADVRRE